MTHRAYVGPDVEPDSRAKVSRCGMCATLVRFWPDQNVWRHVIVDIDHAPEPLDPDGLSEAELRGLWGDR